MRALACLVVLVVACDQGAPAPPAPPRVAQDVSDSDKRAAVLERIRAKLVATKRHRTPLEAPMELTNAYVDLELAYGFAKLGKVDRVHALVAGAHAALAGASDPVHELLIALYDARIDQALAGRAEPASLPLGLAQKVGASERIVRYKVDRLRAVSSVLEGAERIDAIDNWIKHDKKSSSELRTIYELPDEARAKALSNVIDGAPSTPDLGRALDALATVPAALATPVLEHAIQIAASLPAEPRATILAKALFVAGRIDDPGVVPALMPELAAIGGADAAPALVAAVRGLRMLGKKAELSVLLAKLEPKLDPDDPAALLALAGGWFVVGDVARATRIVDAALLILANPMVLTKRLEVSKALAFAYANTTIERAEPALERVAAQYGDITDSYSTNSHYCLSAIMLVDALVIGVVGMK